MDLDDVFLDFVLSLVDFDCRDDVPFVRLPDLSFVGNLTFSLTTATVDRTDPTLTISRLPSAIVLLNSNLPKCYLSVAHKISSAAYNFHPRLFIQQVVH